MASIKKKKNPSLFAVTHLKKLTTEENTPII